MARPRIPIEPYIEKLCQAILVGATYKLAALYAGISEDTFARWRQRMRTARAGTPLARLRERLREAEAQAALHWLAQIQAAAAEDWHAAAFMLERRYPESYGRQVVDQRSSGDSTQTIQVVLHRYAESERQAAGREGATDADPGGPGAPD
jgi:transposase